MEKNIRVLFVEDEESLGLIVKDSLCSRGFEVDYCTNGAVAYNKCMNYTYDVLILDVMLPEMDGFTVAREVRKKDQDTPILFLTAKSQPQDVVQGFEIGGNDYLKKPFSIEELIVRLKALVGRMGSQSKKELQNCYVGNYYFDILNQTLSLNGKERSMTHRETEILKMLYENRNQVLERKEVLQKIWGDDHFFNARSMDVFITRLRKYLRDDSSVKIVNLRGIGYKLIL